MEEYTVDSIVNAKSNRTQIELNNNIGPLDISALMGLADIIFCAKVSLLSKMSNTVEFAVGWQRN